MCTLGDHRFFIVEKKIVCAVCNKRLIFSSLRLSQSKHEIRLEAFYMNNRTMHVIGIDNIETAMDYFSILNRYISD